MFNGLCDDFTAWEYIVLTSILIGASLIAIGLTDIVIMFLWFLIIELPKFGFVFWGVMPIILGMVLLATIHFIDSTILSY